MGHLATIRFRKQGNDDANAAFENGKTAMRIMGSWFANNVYTDKANNKKTRRCCSIDSRRFQMEKENQQIGVVDSR